jgi:hypothetical protein
MDWPPWASIEYIDRSLPSTDAWLSLLFQWLCWERNWGRSRGPLSQAERWSREEWYMSNNVDDSRKVAICRPRVICMVEGHTRTERGKHVVCWSGFPYRVGKLSGLVLGLIVMSHWLGEVWIRIRDNFILFFFYLCFVWRIVFACLVVCRWQVRHGV